MTSCISVSVLMIEGEAALMSVIYLIDARTVIRPTPESPS